ncbi:MAG: tRNA (adenosine(37)-N6)-threonylcarbamoyltransferase complex transferase subunit TsaD [Actinobacteria bacterium]|nr:tRNA (adenosine(37)-N6)-threonylcarbamoyltransferase complex transferase subunit TsaD [Actinomycetota bacterium]
MAAGLQMLAIETSCDETAVAVLSNGRTILSNMVASQISLHERFGGVVPEIASRRHLEVINPLLKQALEKADAGFVDISAVAVTIGPGLVGALLIGLGAAKAISYVTGLPLVGVNHIEGHLFANFLEHPDLRPPLVCLIVSGGHTSIVYMPDFGKYELVGETLDDAVGEAYDKVSNYLGLGYPGGPVLDGLAKDGDPSSIHFPRAMLHDGFDFSLSGLKTAVLNYVTRERSAGREVNVANLAASFQAAVVDVLVAKTVAAAQRFEVENVALAGGVAANSGLRAGFEAAASKTGFELFYPSPALCTDNAAMIAAAGYYRFLSGERLPLTANPDPNLRLT